MSKVRVWSYDSTTKRAKTITAHDGEHIARASIQGDKFVMLLSSGKMEESSIHLALLSKAKVTKIEANKKTSKKRVLRRYDSVLTQEENIRTTSDHHPNHPNHLKHAHNTNTSASTPNLFASDALPQATSREHETKENATLFKHQYPTRNGLGILCSALYKYDISDVSASDTQAAMVVNGKLYTWGQDPTILGHPALPVQNESMQTPDVEDVIEGSFNAEDYLQKDIFEERLKAFRTYHEHMCNQAGLMKDGYDASWLEYPKDANALWKRLQQQWLVEMVRALVVAVVFYTMHKKKTKVGWLKQTTKLTFFPSTFSPHSFFFFPFFPHILFSPPHTEQCRSAFNEICHATAIHTH